MIGWLGQGRAKRRAAAAEEDYVRQAKSVVQDFRNRALEYELAVDTLNTLLASAGALLPKQFGKAGRNAAGSLAAAWPTFIEQIEHIQREREERRFLAIMGSIPEFSIGGKVPGLGNGMLAVLHPGEFVMRKSAVDSLGGEFLAALNKAPQFADGGPVSKGDSRLVPRGNLSVTINNYALPWQTPKEIAQYTIRELRRELLDRGRDL